MSSRRKYRPHGLDGQALIDWMLAQTVTTATGCMEWQRTFLSNGYGAITHKRRVWTAPRLLLHLQGRLPPGLHALHSCDNRPCINPEHLRAGTHVENVRDAVTRRRNYTKLRAADIPAIRHMRDRGDPLREIAARFGVAPTTVASIVLGNTWSHVA